MCIFSPRIWSQDSMYNRLEGSAYCPQTVSLICLKPTGCGQWKEIISDFKATDAKLAVVC